MSKLSFNWDKVKLTKKFLNEKFYNDLYFVTVALINNKIHLVKECLKKDKNNFKYITNDILVNLAQLSQFTLLLQYFDLLSVSQIKETFNQSHDNVIFYFFKLATDTDILKLLKYNKYIPFDLIDNTWYILRVYLVKNYNKKINTKVLEKIISYSKKFILKSRYKINVIVDGCLNKYNEPVLDLLYKHFPNSLSDHDYNLHTPLISAIVLKNNLLANYLLNYDIDINYYGRQYAIIVAITNSNNEIISRLLDKKVNVNVYNSWKWYCGHLIFHKETGITLENKKRILSMTKNLNIPNLNSSTILHLICATNSLEIYKDILKKQKLVLDIFDVWDKSPVHYCSDIPLLKSITKQDKLIDKILSNKCVANNIDIIKPVLQPYSIFTGTQHDSLIYFVYFAQQFKINIHKSNKLYDVKEKYSDVEMKKIIEIYKRNMLSRNIFQYTNIIWYDKDNYCYSENIVNVMKKENGISFIYVTIVEQEFDHANCLIIDHNLKRVIHFEPYGVIDGKRFRDFDTHIEKLFKPLKYKYYAPKDYLSQVSFQSLSNEYNKMLEHLGDIGGFCLAWTLWFVELYIKNQDTDNLKVLVDKAICKIIYTKYSFLQYIRSYAHKLSIGKRDILLSIDIASEDIYKIHKTDIELNFMLNGLTNLLN